MKSLFTHIFIPLLLCMVLLAGKSYAKVSGVFEWDYGHFESEEAGVEVDDATSFGQKYSLWYEKQGNIMGGRGGRYDFLLGGEWSQIEAEIIQNTVKKDIDIETSKILYRGDFVFAPGGLPFRFHAFSYDTKNARFEYDNGFFSEGNFDYKIVRKRKGSILTPDIVTDVDDGTHIKSGASLTLGIRNGSYLGKYRDVLSSFPKLYVDYRENYVKDLESLTPVHFTEREIAFVSLNKKNNWIHYRLYDYTNELTPANDSSTKIFLIGTVDQYMTRDWINLTNWVQLSTDGSLSSEVNPRDATGKEQRYNLNFFLKTTRANVRSNLFANMNRWEKVDQLERNAYVPFFASGDMSRDTSWRVSLIGEAEKTTRPFSLVNTESNREVAYASTRWDLRKTTRYKVAPTLEVETVNGNKNGDGSGFRTALEIISNSNLIKSYDLFAELVFSYIQEEQNAFIVSDQDYWQVDTVMDYAKTINSRLRAGVESELVYGSGEVLGSVLGHIDPVYVSDIIGSSFNAGGAKIRDEVQNLNLLFFAEHVTRNRFRNRVEVSTAYTSIDDADFNQYYVSHGLDYGRAALDVRISTNFFIGDNLKRDLGADDNSTLVQGAFFDGRGLNSTGRVRYTPSRNWSTSAELGVDWIDADAGDTGGLHYEILQNLFYKKYAAHSRMRKLYELEQYFNYEIFDFDNGNNENIWMLALRGNCYPTNWSKLGAKIRLQQDVELGMLESGYGVYADLNFGKLDVGMEYELGMRTDDDLGTVMDRDEQRWKINIRKTF